MDGWISVTSTSATASCADIEWLDTRRTDINISVLSFRWEDVNWEMSVFTMLRELVVGFIQPSEMVCCFDDSIASLEIRDEVTKRRKISLCVCVSIYSRCTSLSIDRAQKLRVSRLATRQFIIHANFVKCVPDPSEAHSEQLSRVVTIREQWENECRNNHLIKRHCNINHRYTNGKLCGGYRPTCESRNSFFFLSFLLTFDLTSDPKSYHSTGRNDQNQMLTFFRTRN